MYWLDTYINPKKCIPTFNSTIYILINDIKRSNKHSLE